MKKILLSVLILVLFCGFVFAAPSTGLLIAKDKDVKVIESKDSIKISRVSKLPGKSARVFVAKDFSLKRGVVRIAGKRVVADKDVEFELAVGKRAVSINPSKRMLVEGKARAKLAKDVEVKGSAGKLTVAGRRVNIFPKNLIDSVRSVSKAKAEKAKKPLVGRAVVKNLSLGKEGYKGVIKSRLAGVTTLQRMKAHSESGKADIKESKFSEEFKKISRKRGLPINVFSRDDMGELGREIKKKLAGRCKWNGDCAFNQKCEKTGFDLMFGDCVNLNCEAQGKVALNHTCVDCTADEHCATDKFCSGNSCTDLNCPEGSVVFNHACVECIADEHCAAGEECTNNSCAGLECEEPTPVPFEHSCVECVVNSDCRSTEQCIDNSCAAIVCEEGISYNHKCVDCIEDNDCAYNEFCSGNECVAFECTDTENYFIYNHSCVELTCTDTDGGRKPYTKGIITGRWGCPDSNNPIVTETDYCIDANTVYEYYCNRGCDNILATEIGCLQGCQDGACITTTLIGGRTYRDYMESDTIEAEPNFRNQILTHDTLSHLYYEESKAFTCGGTTYSATMQEKLQFTADAEYRDSTNKPGLGVKITSGQLDYIVDLGSGVYDNEQCTALGTTNFSDDANDSVRIPLFGEWYYINAFDRTNLKLTLVKTTGTKLYSKGDIIEGLKGKDGEDYIILVEGAATSAGVTKMYFTVKDANGDAVSDSTGFEAGEEMIFYDTNTGAELLDTYLYLDAIMAKVEGESHRSLKEGDTIPNLKGKDGELYTLVVDGGATVGGVTKMYFTVKDANGDAVSDSNGFSAGEEMIFYYTDTGAEILEASLVLDRITTQNNSFAADISVVTGRYYRANILVGTDRVLIKSGSGYPYDATKTADEYDWDATITTMNGKITQITISNKSSYAFTGGGILHFGDELAWINDYGKLKFLGFQLPAFEAYGVTSTESVSYFNLGDGKLFYKDYTYEASHTLPFYVLQGGVIDNDSGTFEIDGKTIWWKIDLDDQTDLDNQTVFDGHITFRKESSTGDIIAKWLFLDEEVVPAAFFPIKFEGRRGVTHDYALLVDETVAGAEANFWLMLDAQNFTTQHNKILSFKGTDTDEDGTVDKYYYEPNGTEMPSSFGGGDSYDSHNYKVAQWVFYEDGVKTGPLDMNFFIDTAEGNLLKLPAENVYLSYYTHAVDYNAGGNGNANWHLNRGNPNLYISEGYTDYGTYVGIWPDYVAHVESPENRAQVELLITGPETTVVIP